MAGGAADAGKVNNGGKRESDTSICAADPHRYRVTNSILFPVG
jgi:hypothetical protein